MNRYDEDLYPIESSNPKKDLRLIIAVVICLIEFVALIIVSLILLLVLKRKSANLASDFPPDESRIPIVEAVQGKIGGAAQLQNQNYSQKSPYYHSYNFYSNSPSSTLIKLDKFKTYQQTSPYSCGCAASLMVLYHYGITQYTENELFVQLNTATRDNPHFDGSIGTSTSDIANWFLNHRFSVLTNTTFKFKEDFSSFVQDHLKEGHPILVENVEWGGHWMVLIGYDNMGTETTRDDVLILADPYDTTDHFQDGYLILSFERFYDMWFDHNVLPMNQRFQQFVVAYPKDF
jgi:hypothetical protein